MKRIAILPTVTVVAGCATSMPAEQFYDEFPKATESVYLSLPAAEGAVEAGICEELAARHYSAPVGLTVYDDVRNGAKGVDAIVDNDGGNAYTIASYTWEHLPSGATQLEVTFHTLDCGPGADKEGEATAT